MPDIDERIREFCQQVRVGRTVDEPVQTELQSHIREKVDEYLSMGLSEDDALFLAFSKFGDPEKVRRMMQSVHGGAAAVSLAERVIACTCVVLLVRGFYEWVVRVAVWAPLYLEGQYPANALATLSVLGLLPVAVLLGFIAWIIYRAIRTHRTGRFPRLVRQYRTTRMPFRMLLWLSIPFAFSVLAPRAFFGPLLPPDSALTAGVLRFYSRIAGAIPVLEGLEMSTAVFPIVGPFLELLRGFLTAVLSYFSCLVILGQPARFRNVLPVAMLPLVPSLAFLAALAGSQRAILPAVSAAVLRMAPLALAPTVGACLVGGWIFWWRQKHHQYFATG